MYAWAQFELAKEKKKFLTKIVTKFHNQTLRNSQISLLSLKKLKPCADDIFHFYYVIYTISDWNFYYITQISVIF